tara:strand:+ start:153 stop:575 length:423 start_codon:yes stop_codon:yes gene_type:complete
MIRDTRNTSHQKQERMQIRRGVPNVDELSEGVPVLRSVSGVGLVQFIRYNGQLYASAFTNLIPITSSGVEISRLTDGNGVTPSVTNFNGSISNVIDWEGDDEDLEDDISAIAGKINEIILALRNSNIIKNDPRSLDSSQR